MSAFDAVLRQKVYATSADLSDALSDLMVGHPKALCEDALVQWLAYVLATQYADAPAMQRRLVDLGGETARQWQLWREQMTTPTGQAS